MNESERQALMKAADATPFKPDGTFRNRVEELAHHAHGRGMKRIGVAFCVSLLKESQRLAHLLQAGGLETELVCCRVGAVDHDEIGLPKAHPGRFAAICNPDAPVTTLVVKDRALDHHTVAALRALPAGASHDVSPTRSQVGEST